MKRSIYQFLSYKEYVQFQRRKALRTRSITKRYAVYRAEISAQLNHFCPKARTMLCVGARSEVELEDFESRGFQVTGIDLFATPRIIKCDMAKLDRHHILKSNTFDCFVAIHSIEHCLDFAGFCRSFKMCNQALACVTPLIRKPSIWDCSAFDFAHPNAGPHAIEEAFPEFRLVWHHVIRKTLCFLMLKREFNSLQDENPNVTPITI
jgi:hypothetical protein